MNFEELYQKLADLPDPADENGEEPAIFKMDFCEASLEDLKKIAFGEASKKWSEDEVSNAAVQAYRVIAMRGEVEEFPFFLELLMACRDCFVEEVLAQEFPWVMSQLGGKVVPEALKVLWDETMPEIERGIISEGLDGLAKEGVETEVIYGAYGDFLRERRPERTINAYLAWTLIQERPQEYQEEILGVYDANVVDVSINGDREEVEIQLGIREVRESERRKPYELEKELMLDFRRAQLGEFPEDGEAVERVDYILQLYQMEGSVPDVSALDGIYAVVICSPVMVGPADLFHLPWGLQEASPGNGPEYANEEDAQRAVKALQDFYNEICDGINQLTYIPAIPVLEEEGDEPVILPTPWLVGVLMGVIFLEDHSGENAYTRKISKMVQARLDKLEAGAGLASKRASQIVMPLVEELILARHKNGGRMGSHEPTELVIRESPKVGRNDPCPCGSGKKFKKCCAD